MDSLLYSTRLLTETAARKVLEPYLGTLAECFGEGVNAWQTVRRSCPTECLYLPTRTWAGIIHANTAQAARLAFRNMEPEVKLYNDSPDAADDNSYLAIDFLGQVVLRFKKLRKDLRPSCYKTEVQKLFDSQEPEPLLFGTAPTLVTAGYRLDRLAASIKDIHVVAWLNDIQLFAIPLPMPATISVPLAIEQTGQRRRTRVRAKDRRRVEGQ